MTTSKIIACAAVAALASTALAQDASTTLAACEAKLVQAQKLDLLSNIRTQGGTTTIYVGDTWYRIDFTAKEGFARTVSCAIVEGKPGLCANFTLADGKSGRAVAKFKNCRLEPT